VQTLAERLLRAALRAATGIPRAAGVVELLAACLELEGLAPEPAPQATSVTPSAVRMREKRRREASHASVTSSVTGGVGGALSLSSEITDQKEIEREGSDACDASRDAQDVTLKVTRKRHRFPETLAPDPDGDKAAYVAWCVQWDFDRTDPHVIAMSRYDYGKGIAWRDWRAALRSWKAKERPSGVQSVAAPNQHDPAVIARARELDRVERERHEARQARGAGYGPDGMPVSIRRTT